MKLQHRIFIVCVLIILVTNHCESTTQNQPNPKKLYSYTRDTITKKAKKVLFADGG